MGKSKTEPPKTTQQKVEPQALPPMPPQRQQMDINAAFNKLVVNLNTISDHITAIKMVGKGIDISTLEAANNENRNLIVALANFIQSQNVTPLNRNQRRRAEREAKKQKT